MLRLRGHRTARCRHAYIRPHLRADPFEDPYGTWAGLREISDGGVLLVRPDLYGAARHASAPDSPESAARWLRQALTSVLGTA